MKKVKVFNCFPSDLEGIMNEWFKGEMVSIISMVQSSICGMMIVTIVYQEIK